MGEHDRSLYLSLRRLLDYYALNLTPTAWFEERSLRRVEYYQLFSLVALTVMLYGSMRVPFCVRCGFAFLAFYRVLDILLYDLQLVLFGQAIRFPARTLVAFLLNLVEVTIAFAIVMLAADCVSPHYQTWGFALYSSLRTLATFGPINVNEAGRACRVILSVHIGVNYFLTLVALAIAVATLRFRVKRPGRRSGNRRVTHSSAVSAVTFAHPG
jgi:hypothetical protein